MRDGGRAMKKNEKRFLAYSRGMERGKPIGISPMMVTRALVQTRLRQGMMRDATVRPDRRSVQRTALRPTDHRFVRELVRELQTELAGSGDHDGRPRHFRDAYNDSPVGPALPAGVLERLAGQRSTRRRIGEDGRDLCEGSRTMGVPVPRRRQSGPNSLVAKKPKWKFWSSAG